MNNERWIAKADCPDCGKPASAMDITTVTDEHYSVGRIVIRCDSCGYSHAFIYQEQEEEK